MGLLITRNKDCFYEVLMTMKIFVDYNYVYGFSLIPIL